VTTGQSDGVLGRPPVCNASGGNENVGVNGLVVAAVKPVEPSQSKLTAPAGPMKLSAVRVRASRGHTTLGYSGECLAEEKRRCGSHARDDQDRAEDRPDTAPLGRSGSEQHAIAVSPRIETIVYCIQVTEKVVTEVPETDRQ